MLFEWPMKGGKDLFPIGPIENGVNQGTSEAHLKREELEAIDIPAPFGTEITAIHDATIGYTGWMGEAGIVVEYVFDTEQDYFLCRACHIQDGGILVNYGQRVLAGESIGLVGNTGLSTGPHEHFVMELNGNRVNPENYL